MNGLFDVRPSPVERPGWSDQVRARPVQRTPGLLDGWTQPNYQSFNPFGNQSAGLFDQYMMSLMQQRPGGFFGFQPPPMPQIPMQASPGAGSGPPPFRWTPGENYGGGA